MTRLGPGSVLVATGAVLAALLGAVVFTLLHHPWHWSLIDDPGQALLLRQQIHVHGYVVGAASRFVEAAKSDWHWGLFRPSYWVYVSTFYLLTPTAAHALRAGLLAVAIFLPLTMAYRGSQGGRVFRLAVVGWGLCVLACNNWLWDTISLTSLQELPGIVFVAVGCLSEDPRLRLTCWTIAAWFKTPFAWLLVVLGITWWLRRQRREAIVSAALGLATLVVATTYAKHGTYTHGFRFQPQHLGSNADTLWHRTWPTLIALVIGAFFLRVDYRTLRPSTGLPTVLAFGGVLYALNLLPWHAGSWYPIPPVWLIGVAGVVAFSRSSVSMERNPGKWSDSILPSVPILAAIALIAYQIAWRNVDLGVRDQFKRDTTTARLLAFAQHLPPGTRIGVNGREAATRLDQMLPDKVTGKKVQFVFKAPAKHGHGAFPYNGTIGKLPYYVWVNLFPGVPAGSARPVEWLPCGAIWHARQGVNARSG